MNRRFNLVDFALLLLALAVFGALVLQVVKPSWLRRTVVDEAERRDVEIEVESDSAFLADSMTPGDAQTLSSGERGVELLDVRRKDAKLVARLKVRARIWRGWAQYGESALVPGESFTFLTSRYKFVGTIVHVGP